MSPRAFTTMVYLHHNQWDEYLLSKEFRYIRTKILTKQEARITEMKVSGKSDTAIVNILKIKPETYRRYIYNIKYKFRNGTRRVDNNILMRKIKRARGGK